MNIDHSAINMQNIAISKREDPTSLFILSLNKDNFSTVEMEVDLAQFFATQNISYNSAKNDDDRINITHLDRSRSKGSGSAD